jgi:hypothetical protein
MVESLFIHKNIEQQDLGLLEVRSAENVGPCRGMR